MRGRDLQNIYVRAFQSISQLVWILIEIHIDQSQRSSAEKRPKLSGEAKISGNRRERCMPET